MTVNELCEERKVTGRLSRLPFDVNLAIIVGTVEARPRLEYTSRCQPIARLVVVTRQERIRQNGESVSETVRHHVVLVGGDAERATDELNAGDRISITGRIKTRFKERDNDRKIFITEVIGERWHRE
jgi:single-stranded DNA-binding protein